MNDSEKEKGERNHLTIAIWESTKNKLDKHRAPGQCYNGFICQLIERWEETNPICEAPEGDG
jgi:hypothetical protein